MSSDRQTDRGTGETYVPVYLIILSVIFTGAALVLRLFGGVIGVPHPKVELATEATTVWNLGVMIVIFFYVHRQRRSSRYGA